MLKLAGSILGAGWKVVKGLGIFAAAAPVVGVGGVAYDQLKNDGEYTQGLIDTVAQKAGKRLVKPAGDAGERLGNEAAQISVENKFQGIWANIEKLLLMIDKFLGGGTVAMNLANKAREMQDDKYPLAYDGQKHIETAGAKPENKPADSKAPPTQTSTNTLDATKTAEAETTALPSAIGAGVGLATAKTATTIAPALSASSIPVLAGSVAPIAARLGAKAIPVVASFSAAADGLYDTGKYALDGEFKKAAVRLLSGTAETVGGVFGIASYGVGLAARETIENTLAPELPDSEIVSGVKQGYDWLTGGRQP